MAQLVLVPCRTSRLERDHELDKVHDRPELVIGDGQDILVPTICREAYRLSLARRKCCYLLRACVHVIYLAEANDHQFCVELLG